MALTNDLSATDFDSVLVIGHGTRDSAGLAEFWQLVDLLRRQQPAWRIEGCFLELAQPTIAEGLSKLARQGARRVRAVPLLLFAAGHAKRDIPAALAAAAAGHSELIVAQTPHLGCHEAVVELSERRFLEAIGDQSLIDPVPTLLLLVGRGSNDAAASHEMHAFAACRAVRGRSEAASDRPDTPSPPLFGVPSSEFRVCRFNEIDVAFLALAEPRLSAALEAARQSSYQCCVVQPHLLFAGLLLADLRAAVDRMAAETPNKRWIVAEPLGPDIRLAAAVADIVAGEIASSDVETKNQTAARYVLNDG